MTEDERPADRLLDAGGSEIEVGGTLLAELLGDQDESDEAFARRAQQLLLLRRHSGAEATPLR